VLDCLQWDAFIASGEEIRIPAAADEHAREVFAPLPLVAQDSEAIRLAPDDEPDTVVCEEDIDRSRVASNGEV
jgi:hypothetical protein